MQNDWNDWCAGLEKVRAATRPSPMAATMLTAVLLSVASEIGRIRLPAMEADGLAEQVRVRLMGLDG